MCRRGKRPTPRTHMMCPYAGGLARCSSDFRCESSYRGICLSVLQLVSNRRRYSTCLIHSSAFRHNFRRLATRSDPLPSANSMPPPTLILGGKFDRHFFLFLESLGCWHPPGTSGLMVQRSAETRPGVVSVFRVKGGVPARELGANWVVLYHSLD